MQRDQEANNLESNSINHVNNYSNVNNISYSTITSNSTNSFLNNYEQPIYYKLLENASLINGPDSANSSLRFSFQSSSPDPLLSNVFPESSNHSTVNPDKDYQLYPYYRVVFNHSDYDYPGWSDELQKLTDEALTKISSSTTDGGIDVDQRGIDPPSIASEFSSASPSIFQVRL